MSEDKVFLTAEQAESILVDGDNIHTFRSSTFTLIGADWSRKEIIKAIIQAHIRGADNLEIGGEQCKRMGHSLVIWTSDNNPLFVECDKVKSQKLEDELLKQLEK